MNSKKILLLLFMVMTSTTLSAMRVSGRLTVKRSTSIGIMNINRKPILEITLKQSGEFTPAEVDILPDVYIFKIGESEEYVYLDGTDITITGYLDPDDAAKSRLSITGIDSNAMFQTMFERFKGSRSDPGIILAYAETNAVPSMLTAMMSVAPMRNYESYMAVLDVLPDDMAPSTSYLAVKHMADSLYAYRIGGPAYDFTLRDTNMNEVRLSDFRGKYVLLDFWASWCNPCRQEIQRMKKFYPGYADKNIVFISISLDDTKEEWQTGLDGEGIPWTVLWDDSGGMNISPLKGYYGFRSIPFIVIIDKEGNTLARGLRDAAIDRFLSTLDLE